MKVNITSSKFVKTFFGFLIVFIIYHLLIWNLYTSKIFDCKPYSIGDIGRMSYQLDSLHYRLDERILQKHAISYNQYKEGMNIDIITIGDSFSNGGAYGLNPLYQDYLATKTEKNILNIQNINDQYTYIETLNALLENG
jgi:hypothetical protein